MVFVIFIVGIPIPEKMVFVIFIMGIPIPEKIIFTLKWGHVVLGYNTLTDPIALGYKNFPAGNIIIGLRLEITLVL